MGKRRRSKATKDRSKRDSHPQTETAEEKNPWRRWLIALRNAFGMGIGSVVLALPLKFFGFVPETVVVRLFAIVTLVSAIIYAVRTEMHLEILRLEGSKGWMHELVIALELVVTLVFLGFGPYCFLNPDGAIQFLGALFLLVAVFTLALATAWLSEQDVRTGTDAASDCDLIIFVRWGILKRADSIRFFNWLDRRWEIIAEKGKVSYLAIWLCAALLSVASANGPRVAPAAYEFLKGRESVKVVSEGHEERHTEPKEDKPLSAQAGTAGVEAIVDVREVSSLAPPSYDELCAGGPSPGEPAPETERLALYRRWLAGGLGAVFAGCARLASRLPSEAWYAPGYCGDSLRSLAVATPAGESEMVLWSPASFAFARAHEGTLLNVTSSQLVDQGEVYTVETEAGTHTFVRDDLPGDSGLSGRPPQNCHEVHPGPPFLRLPPALSRLWASYVGSEGIWAWPLAEEHTAGGIRYLFEDPKFGSREIVGYCRTGTDCELRVEGVISRSTGRGAIDVDTVIGVTENS